jgi:alpha-mannosidase
MVVTPINQRRIQRNRRRVEELRVWRNAREAELTDIRMVAPDGAETALGVGSPWPVVATPVRFSLSSSVPSECAGQPVELELWLGGEGFAEISLGDGPTMKGAIDPYHFQYPLTDAAADGEAVSVDATVVPKGVFGSRIDHPVISRAHLVVPAEPVRAIERDLSVALLAAVELDAEGHEIVPRLLDAIEASLTVLSTAWPTDTETTVSRLVLAQHEPLGDGVFAAGGGYAEHARLFTNYVNERWSAETATQPLTPLSDTVFPVIDQARETLASDLATLRAAYPSIGAVALTGHAHIDLGWLWPVEETRRKIVRTGWSVMNLMDRYPDFIHNQSSAQVYAWLEQDDPALLERIKARAAEGRWDPIGGMWVEPDNQLTGGEAMVRQALYGQREFERHFGRRGTVAWLPDSFGFSGGLPQILRGAGLTRFFTHKMTWNEANEFPYDLFEWEGVDGTRVLAHQFRNEDPASGYNAEIAPRDLRGTWRKFAGKRHHDETLLAFGMGDGGGGPSQQMLEYYARLRSYPVLPALRMTRVEAFFERIPESDLPVWTGEMYLELHRGTLSTQGRTKKLNRESEQRLAEAETLSAFAHLFGGTYPIQDLTAAWKVLLLNQFHDILPGSSIKEVYEVTEPELRGVVETATAISSSALTGIGGDRSDGSALRIANTSLAARPLTIVLPGVTGVTDTDGEPVAGQLTEAGLLVHAADIRVPGLGWTTLLPGDAAGNDLAVSGGNVNVHEEDGAVTVENGLLRIVIGQDGTLHSATDLEHDRALFTERGNQIWAYVDKPHGWDAWDVAETIEQQGEEILATEPLAIVERGPLRVAVRAVRRWRGSTITQTYRLLADSRLIEIETEIDWHERQTLLRARQPLNIHTHEASFETLYGVVRRPTYRNTSWELAQFEVAGHRFADLSEANYGVALLNDGRYGHSVDRNVMTLTLLRSPIDPDMRADEGRHAFRYGLLPHTGTYATGGVVDAAVAFNSPLLPGQTSKAASDLPTDWALVTSHGLPVVVGALKRAEDDNSLILRLHEPNGARGEVHLQFTVPLATIERVNLLEDVDDTGGPVTVSADGAVRFAVRPYEIVSLRLIPGDVAG